MDDSCTNLFPAHMTLPPLFGSDDLQFAAQSTAITTTTNRPSLSKQQDPLRLLDDPWLPTGISPAARVSTQQQYAFSESNSLDPRDFLRRSPRKQAAMQRRGKKLARGSNQSQFGDLSTVLPPSAVTDSGGKNPQLIAAKRRVLNKAFAENPRPSRLKLDHLSKILGMDFDLIRRWFSRKRQITNNGGVTTCTANSINNAVNSPLELGEGTDAQSRTNENLVFATNVAAATTTNSQTSESAAEQFRKSRRLSKAAVAASLTGQGGGSKGASVFYDWMLKSPRKKIPGIRRRSTKVIPVNQQQQQPPMKQSPNQLRFEEFDFDGMPVRPFAPQLQSIFRCDDKNVFSSPGPLAFHNNNNNNNNETGIGKPLALPGSISIDNHNATTDKRRCIAAAAADNNDDDNPFTDSHPLGNQKNDLLNFFNIASEPPAALSRDIFTTAETTMTANKVDLDNVNNINSQKQYAGILDAVNLSPGSDASRLLQQDGTPGKQFEHELLKLFSESPRRTAESALTTNVVKNKNNRRKSPRKKSQLSSQVLPPDTDTQPATETVKEAQDFFDSITSAWDDFL